MTGNLEVWNRLEALGRTPYVAGDTYGNAVYAAHALGAGIFAYSMFSHALVIGKPLGLPT